jgi:hypothetical protein
MRKVEAMPNRLGVDRSRIAAVIYRGLSRSEIDPASLTVWEIEGLRLHCKRLVRKLQSKAGREWERGRNRIAGRYQTELFEGLAPRLVAAWDAHRDTEAKRKRAKQPTMPPEHAFPHVWDLAVRLKNPHATSVAFRRTKPKSKGGYREFYEFNAFGKAKHVLFVNAVKPFASFHSSQFLLRRGRLAACETLLSQMNRTSQCDARVIQFDVKDMFPSVSLEWVEGNVRAPKAIIRNTVFVQGWRIIGRGVNAMMDRRGLPQGSAASSYIAEMVMADVLCSAAGQLRDVHQLVTYSDDGCGFVPRTTDVAALEAALKHAFFTHGAGPFHITTQVTEALSQPFRFLGYWYEKLPGVSARAFLPDEVWQTQEMQYVNDFDNALTAEEMLHVCDRLRSYCAAFNLAAETQLLMTRVVRFMNEELERRAQRRSGDLLRAA